MFSTRRRQRRLTELVESAERAERVLLDSEHYRAQTLAWQDNTPTLVGNLDALDRVGSER